METAKVEVQTVERNAEVQVMARGMEVNVEAEASSRRPLWQLSI